MLRWFQSKINQAILSASLFVTKLSYRQIILLIGSLLSIGIITYFISVAITTFFLFDNYDLGGPRFVPIINAITAPTVWYVYYLKFFSKKGFSYLHSFISGTFQVLIMATITTFLVMIHTNISQLNFDYYFHSLGCIHFLGGIVSLLITSPIFTVMGLFLAFLMFPFFIIFTFLVGGLLNVTLLFLHRLLANRNQ